MALIRFAEGQQRSGSVGGTVFSRNRFGAYIRARSVPVNPNTARQVVVRNLIRALAIAWQTELTQVQRDQWNVYAANVNWNNRLGQVVNLTGLNHFTRSNVPRLQAAMARVDDGPAIFTLAPAELALAAAASEATQDATVTFDAAAAWTSEDGAAQLVYGGLPKNSAINFFRGPYRFAGKILGDAITPPTSPEAFTWPFQFGEDNQLWLRTRISLADGRLSEFAIVNFLALA